MNSSLTWRAVLIVAVIALAVWLAYPPQETIKLGLDLQGGMHLVLQVKTTDALRSETDKDMDALRRQAEEGGLSGITTRRLDDTSFEVSGVPRDREQVIAKAAQDLFERGLGQSALWSWSRRGEVLAFEMSEANKSDIQEQSVVQALQTIRNRVDAFGVAEPLIVRQGLAGDRIVVQLPGVDDPERIRRLIKNTAFLEFRLVHKTFEDAFPSYASTREEALGVFGGSLPPDAELFPQDLKDQDGRPTGQVWWVLEQRQVVTGRDLRTSRPSTDEFGAPVVLFELTPEGGRIFGRITGANVGRKLAIVLDSKVQSAPVLQSKITDSGQISGGFTAQQVQDLVLTLKSGALPAGIDYLEERTVGASLGRDSIEQGYRAGLIGGILVVLAMLIVYRLAGANAVLALALNVVLIFGALAYFGATLTLPGIAGIILTIGMAVDANVLVFERIKEELAAGRTVRSAIDAGFGKALSSILDANITTLIAALFLFQFGTGPIRGFAVTLSIGILASMFTAVFVSRFIFDLTLSGRRREKLSI